MPEFAHVPYNFVPLPDRIVAGDDPPGRDSYAAGRHCGWFDIEAETLTPTYTRAAVGIGSNYAPPTSEHAGQPSDFFHHGDTDRTPVIPGSSLRGMSRMLYEIMTSSRIDQFERRRYFFRSFAAMGQTGLRDLYMSRFSKDRLVGGILAKDGDRLALRVSTGFPKGFVVIDARDVEPNISGKYYSSHERSVTISEDMEPERYLEVRKASLEPRGIRRRDAHQAWLIIPGRDIPRRDRDGRPVGQRRWYQAILKPDETEVREYAVPDDVYADYLAWGKMAHGARFERNDGNAPRKLEAGQPAFALVDESGDAVEVIGANMMMALRYRFGVGDVAARHGSQDSAEVNTSLDMATALFGCVGANRQIKGRVSFGDLTCRTGSPWLADPDLRWVELLGPKPTSFQLYLQQPGGEPVNWENPDARLSGRKLYWHRPSAAAEAALHREAGKHQSVETCIRPVREGVRFTGRVRFENLSDEELYGLYATLQLPSNMAHKMGMAKSLGLGSVRIHVKDVALFDMPARYSSLSESGLRPATAASAVLENGRQSLITIARGRKATDIWRGPRMKALAALLTFEPKLDAELTAVPPVNDRQWKDRRPLEDAVSLFEGDTGRAIVLQDVLPPGVTRPDVPAAGSGPARPAPIVPTTPEYKPGDIVTLEVVSSNGYSGQVRLPDGKILAVSPIGRTPEGQKGKFKIVRASGGGQIKEVRPA